LHRKYVIPFVLACVILACNQATGINSIIGYNANILWQSGLSDVQAHWGYVLFTIVNFVMTIGGVMLVDRKGRKFLLSVEQPELSFRSSAPACSSARRNACVWIPECRSIDGYIRPADHAALRPKLAETLLELSGGAAQRTGSRPTSLVVIYSYGDFHAATKAARSDDVAATPIEITRQSCVPANKVVAVFSNPFGDLGRRASGSAEN